MIDYKDLDFDLLDQESLDYVWQNLREHDRTELALQNYTDENYSSFLTHSEAYSAHFKGNPIFAFGMSIRSHCMYFWLIATDELDKNKQLWKSAHELALAYIPKQAEINFGKRQLVEVWIKHRNSVRWLNRLGFTDTGFIREVNGEILKTMEKTRIGGAM